MTYFIGEFARISNFSIDTLRYYEKVGFLRPQRNTSNRRIYTDQDLKWVKFIKRLKQTGMPIHEINQYAALRYQGDQTMPERFQLLLVQEKRLNEQAAAIQQDLDFLHHKMVFYQDKMTSQNQQ